MKALQTKLDRAQEVNERDIPSEMLSCVPEPDLEEATTQLFDAEPRFRTALTQKAGRGCLRQQGPGPWPARGRRVDVCCDTRGLAPELREFLPLLSEVLLKAPKTKMVQ